MAINETDEGDRAMLVDLETDGTYKTTFFLKTLQINSSCSKGTYEVVNDVLVLSQTHFWRIPEMDGENALAPQWVAGTDTHAIPLTISADGNTITIPHPNEVEGATLPLERTVFTRPSGLQVKWVVESGPLSDLVLDFTVSDGGYENYFDSDIEGGSSGTWSATATHIHLITTLDTFSYEGATYYETLAPFTLTDEGEGATLVVSTIWDDTGWEDAESWDAFWESELSLAPGAESFIEWEPEGPMLQ